MKKLKKGLSLLLVLAMVFSLASTAFAAWSTDYEDDDQITQKEAVAVMSAMGIVEGDNGEFDPDGQFTREQAAKIVTYMILGADTAESLQITTNKFSDVSASRWSAKYIAFAANQEIVMGDGNGKFRPADDVSRIEWLKMLLVSLGLDPDENGLGDDPNWAANTQSLAVRSGLVTGKELALDWNRDTAVLYAFNAMKKAQDSTWYQEYVYTGDAKDYKFVRQYAPTLKESTASDVYGREYKTWTNGKTGANAETFATSDTLVASYENQAVKMEKIEDDLDLLTGNEAEFELYVDGVKTAGYVKDADVQTYVAADDELGGRGSVVEVYSHTPSVANGNTYYRIVVINTYVAVVGQIKPNDTTVTLTYNNTADDSGTATAKASVEGLAEGDIVSFNVGQVVKKISAYNVTKLTGAAVTVTAIGNTGMPANEDYVRIEGEQVFASKFVDFDADTVETADDFTDIKTGTVYYDTYGNILYFENATVTNAKQVDGYVYVTEYRAAVGQNGGQLLGEKAAEVKAEVIDLTTGETSKINIGVVYNKQTKAWDYADKNGKDSTTPVTAVKEAAKNSKNGFWGYYLLDDGSYVLEAVDAEGVGADPNTNAATATFAKDAVIANKGQATVTGVTGVYGDTSTKLHIIGSANAAGNYNMTTYTGIANFPKLTAPAANIKALVVSGANKRITDIVVYLGSDIADNNVDPNTYAMLKSIDDIATDSEGNVTYYYTFQINNETVQYGYKDAISGAKVGDVFVINTDDHNAASAVTNTIAGTVVSKEDGYLIIKTDDEQTETVVYLYDGYQTGVTSRDYNTIKAGAHITAAKSEVSEITSYVYVVVDDPAPAAPSEDVEEVIE
jgi:hypothetical protein